MSMKSKTRVVKRKAQANPVTTTGSIGLGVSIIGGWLGWSEELRTDVATLFLLSLPIVNWVTARWFPSLGSSSAEHYENVDAAAAEDAAVEDA